MEAEGQFLSQVEPHFPLPIQTLEPVLARVLCDAAVGNLAQELFGENRISLASSAFGDCPRASENYLATAARRRESCLRHKEAILREAPPRAAHPMRVVAGFKNRTHGCQVAVYTCTVVHVNKEKRTGTDGATSPERAERIVARQPAAHLIPRRHGSRRARGSFAARSKFHAAFPPERSELRPGKMKMRAAARRAPILEILVLRNNADHFARQAEPPSRWIFGR
jgi:hypothetical protein